MIGIEQIDKSRGPQIICTAGTGGVVAFQAVMLYSGLIIPVDGANATHAGYAVGIVLQTLAAGSSGKVQTSGRVVNPAWSLTPGAIYYIGPAGTISDTPPVTGFWQKIGIAKDVHTLIISLGEAIVVI